MKPLRYKIWIGYFVIIAINIAIAVFAIYHIQRLGSPIERVLKEKYQNVSAAENMLLALEQQQYYLSEILRTPGDVDAASTFITYKNEFLNWHEKARQGVALPSEPGLLDSLLRVFYLYAAESDTLRARAGRGENYRNLDAYRQARVLPLASRLKEFCGQLKDVNQSAIRDADRRARQFSDQANLVIITISALAIVLSIFASIRFTLNIVRPIQLTTETVRRIGQGQLNQKIAITTDDEIAELGREFNKMTERLHSYERMNIEQILLEKKRSEAIVAGIPAAIIVTDRAQRIILLNQPAKKLLDLENRSWEGGTLGEVVVDPDLRQALQPSAGVRQPGGDPGKSLVTIGGDPESLHFLVRQLEITGADGQVMGTVTLLQDVTSFKNLDRLKSEFMATISHEFRTPLTSINMALDILLQEIRGELNPAQRELLADARKDGQRLKRLVKDLLDLSKLESGKYQPQRQPLDLAEVVEEALQPLRFFWKAKDIRLEIDIAAGLPPLSGERQRIAQVITNLVKNAIQYTPAGGSVRISAAQAGNDCRICVADSGEGIPEEALELIFDKFVQVKNFSDAAEGNIGLGLAIVREIVAVHRGKIWVESEPGRGSRFYVSLPLAPSETG